MDVHLTLDTDTVEQVATPEPLCVPVDSPVRETLHAMKEKRRSAVLVCKGEKLAGIFTERDALKLMEPGADLDVPVGQLMTSDPETIADSDTVGEAIGKMSRGGYRRLPMVDPEGRPKGFVTVASILHYLVGHFPAIVYNLPPNPHHSTQTREGA
ncbi:MAG: CBS domain-containing protein [Planctomycetaceae bacterium]|nr:CBS domain-containing protein [Planctomycetales bacterium]MCB9923204.1 CBS domain-containing protein [Planctomycetaceae bacterium]